MNATKRFLFAAAVLLACATFAQAAMVTEPPGAPHWWNAENSFYWGYANSPNGQPPDPNNPNQFQSNFQEFAVTVTAQDSTNPGGNHTKGNYFRFELINGYRKELDKYFYFYMSGTGAGVKPVASGVPVTGISDNVPDPSQITLTPGFESTFDAATGAWTAKVLGVAHPQPDRVYFSFNVWGTNTNANTVQVNRWSVGERCVPEPAAVGLVAIVVLAAVARRRG